MIAGSRACSTSTRTTHPNITNQSNPHNAEALRGGVGGPIRGGIRGPLRGPIRGGPGGPGNRCRPSWRPLGIAGRNSATERVLGLTSAERGRVQGPGRVRPMPSPGGTTTRPDRRRRQAHSYSAAGACHREPRGCGGLGRSSLTPGRAGWSRVGPTGRPGRRRRAHKVPEAHRLIGAGAWAVSGPDGAAALVVGRGGGIERSLVACLPDADHGSGGTVRPLRRRPPRLQWAARQHPLPRRHDPQRRQWSESRVDP
jgi:hypothetical protein